MLALLCASLIAVMSRPRGTSPMRVMILRSGRKSASLSTPRLRNFALSVSRRLIVGNAWALSVQEAPLSFRTLPGEHGRNGRDKNVQVEPERPIANIQSILPPPPFKIALAARGYLP